MSSQAKLVSLSKYAQSTRERLSNKDLVGALREFLERDLVKTEKKIADLKLLEIKK
jgi:hypothetical protein